MQHGMWVLADCSPSRTRSRRMIHHHNRWHIPLPLRCTWVDSSDYYSCYHASFDTYRIILLGTHPPPLHQKPSDVVVVAHRIFVYLLWSKLYLVDLLALKRFAGFRSVVVEEMSFAHGL